MATASGGGVLVVFVVDGLKKPPQRRRRQAQQRAAQKRCERTKPKTGPRFWEPTAEGTVGSALASHNVARMWTHAAPLLYTGYFSEAETLLAEIKRKAPMSPWVKIHQSAIRQLQGDYSPSTWAAYKVVRHLPNAASAGLRLRAPFKQPRWDGSPLGPEQTLLVWAYASGLGDWLQIYRMFRAVKAQLGQGRLGIRWPQGMQPLFSRLCPD
jgi:hypothetical protein